MTTKHSLSERIRRDHIAIQSAVEDARERGDTRFLKLTGASGRHLAITLLMADAALGFAVDVKRANTPRLGPEVFKQRGIVTPRPMANPGNPPRGGSGVPRGPLVMFRCGNCFHEMERPEGEVFICPECKKRGPSIMMGRKTTREGL